MYVIRKPTALGLAWKYLTADRKWTYDINKASRFSYPQVYRPLATQYGGEPHKAS